MKELVRGKGRRGTHVPKIGLHDTDTAHKPHPTGHAPSGHVPYSKIPSSLFLIAYFSYPIGAHNPHYLYPSDNYISSRV